MPVTVIRPGGGGGIPIIQEGRDNSSAEGLALLQMLLSQQQIAQSQGQDQSQFEELMRFKQQEANRAYGLDKKRFGLEEDLTQAQIRQANEAAETSDQLQRQRDAEYAAEELKRYGGDGIERLRGMRTPESIAAEFNRQVGIRETAGATSMNQFFKGVRTAGSNPTLYKDRINSLYANMQSVVDTAQDPYEVMGTIRSTREFLEQVDPSLAPDAHARLYKSVLEQEKSYSDYLTPIREEQARQFQSVEQEKINSILTETAFNVRNNDANPRSLKRARESMTGFQYDPLNLSFQIDKGPVLDDFKVKSQVQIEEENRKAREAFYENARVDRAALGLRQIMSGDTGRGIMNAGASALTGFMNHPFQALGDLYNTVSGYNPLGGGSPEPNKGPGSQQTDAQRVETAGVQAEANVFSPDPLTQLPQMLDLGGGFEPANPPPPPAPQIPPGAQVFPAFGGQPRRVSPLTPGTGPATQNYQNLGMLLRGEVNRTPVSHPLIPGSPPPDELYRLLQGMPNPLVGGF